VSNVAGLRRGLIAIIVLTIVLTASSSCTRSLAGSPVADSQFLRPAVQLPGSAWPRFLTFSKDDSLWVTESSGNAVAQIDRHGNVTQHRIPGSDNSPSDIVEAPDSMIWFQGFGMIGRIDHEGNVTGWHSVGVDHRVGWPRAMTVGPDGAIWFTDESVPPRITRVTSDGKFRSVSLPASSTGLTMSGITSGPDAALWFTESSDNPTAPVSAIGRLGTDGRYAQFPVPTARSLPMRIARGPDGALWFTERSAYRIGRISVTGNITEFALPSGTGPFDITAGLDGAMWFTTDKGIGRISTTGEVKLVDLPKAAQIAGIASAADGTFRLADAKGSAIWAFDGHI
jgi:virginiamycin B lyase